MVSSYQRPSNCNRHPGDDGTSRSVWCSHVGWLAPVHGNQVRTRERLLTAPAPGKRKKEKKPLSGGVCLLTRRGLISVRLRVSGCLQRLERVFERFKGGKFRGQPGIGARFLPAIQPYTPHTCLMGSQDI